MDEQKLRGLIGLCTRAGQGTFGEDGCMKAVRTGKCALVLLDAGASEATRAKYEGVCRNAGVPLFILPEGLPGDAAGRPGVAMAVKPGGLANQLMRLLQNEECQNHRKPQDADLISGCADVE